MSADPATPASPASTNEVVTLKPLPVVVREFVDAKIEAALAKIENTPDGADLKAEVRLALLNDIVELLLFRMGKDLSVSRDGSYVPLVETFRTALHKAFDLGDAPHLNKYGFEETVHLNGVGDVSLASIAGETDHETFLNLLLKAIISERKAVFGVLPPPREQFNALHPFPDGPSINFEKGTPISEVIKALQKIPGAMPLSHDIGVTLINAQSPTEGIAMHSPADPVGDKLKQEAATPERPPMPGFIRQLDQMYAKTTQDRLTGPTKESDALATVQAKDPRFKMATYLDLADADPKLSMACMRFIVANYNDWPKIFEFIKSLTRQDVPAEE